MKRLQRWIVVLLVLTGSGNAQSLLRSGPMVGYSEMREAMLWAQTSSAVRVHFIYFDTTAQSKHYSTDTILTSAATAFTAHCVADSVAPGRQYTYELYINNERVERPYPLRFHTPPLWQFRIDPPALRVAFGSCAYVNEEAYDRPGKPYGADYQIFTNIAKTKPDVMVWLGDNAYLREPDWNSRRGIFHRYTHTRSLPEMQALLAASANYAIWDDHDFGPNDCDRGFWNKEQTFEAFKLFWANPRYGMDNKSGGINCMFSWSDVDFFLLDDRWWRTPDKRKTGERQILGKEQFEWLIDNLTSSTATFKIVCIGGQVLNSEALFENFATYADERHRLIDAINAEGISGVVFFSGDRHHTELSLLKNPGYYPIYDFTCSPLTAGPNPRAATEPNKNRVAGTFVGERNFALMDVIGAKDNRSLQFTVFDSYGKQLWQKSISAKEMKDK